MANEEHRLSPAELADKAWELSEKIRTAIFTTWDGEQQRARPLSATLDRDAHAIYFLVGVDGGKTLAEAAGVPALTLVEQIEKFPNVSLAFADHGKTDYVTIIGEAGVSNDRDFVVTIAGARAVTRLIWRERSKARFAAGAAQGLAGRRAAARR